MLHSKHGGLLFAGQEFCSTSSSLLSALQFLLYQNIPYYYSNIRFYQNQDSKYVFMH